MAARLLRSWVRIPPGAWIFVCCECYVLSGRGLCDELITRPEESYRLWCVVIYDQETSRMRRPCPAEGRSATENNTKLTHTLKIMCMTTNEHVFIHPVVPVRSSVATPVQYRFYVVTVLICFMVARTDVRIARSRRWSSETLRFIHHFIRATRNWDGLYLTALSVAQSGRNLSVYRRNLSVENCS